MAMTTEQLLAMANGQNATPGTVKVPKAPAVNKEALKAAYKKALQEQKPIDAGRYEVKLTEHEQFTTSTGNVGYTIVFTIQGDGPFAGKEVRDTYYVMSKDGEINSNSMAAITMKVAFIIGQENSKEDLDEDLKTALELDRVFKVDIRNREHNGKTLSNVYVVK